MLGCPCPVVLRNSCGVLASRRTLEPPWYGDVDPVERLSIAAAGILPGYPFSHRASTLQEDIGRELEIFVLETCEPEGSGAEMVPLPLFLIGKIF